MVVLRVDTALSSISGPRRSYCNMNSNGPWMRAISDPTVDRDDLIRRPTEWIALCWLLFVGLTVFMLCLPFMHSIFDLGDEGLLLHGAERLLRGHRLYIDFFEI